ncbi:hypothetical protein B0T21DRAFT_96432 [Apiosordaria backusii]|uniref:Uncharacterized protein n=1 Tax=Apiosordaria backusii TaxID=314023 RepID=A0AA40ET36_9PEZI|nr:hypothetical protein B0T21DRAFT_96432 [Apiosordaria backusii]
MGSLDVEKDKMAVEGGFQLESQSLRGVEPDGAILPVGTDLGGSSGGVARLTRPCDPVLYVIRSRTTIIVGYSTTARKKTRQQSKRCLFWVYWISGMVLGMVGAVEAKGTTNFRNGCVVAVSIGGPAVGVFEGGTDLRQRPSIP